jgi:hypothetical protein
MGKNKHINQIASFVASGNMSGVGDSLVSDYILDDVLQYDRPDDLEGAVDVSLDNLLYDLSDELMERFGEGSEDRAIDLASKFREACNARKSRYVDDLRDAYAESKAAEDPYSYYGVRRSDF